MAQDRDEWIRRRAHQIWESEGRPDGRHDEHWRTAEQQYQGDEGTAEEAAETADDLERSAGGISALPGSTGSTALEAASTRRQVQSAH